MACTGQTSESLSDVLEFWKGRCWPIVRGHYFWTRLSKRLPGYFTQVDLLAVLLATTIHDVAHPSVSNDFLVKTKELATRACAIAALAWMFTTSAA
eukprot:1868657-Amphidinium_carterae.1